jgi:hypothetical protein
VPSVTSRIKPNKSHVRQNWSARLQISQCIDIDTFEIFVNSGQTGVETEVEEQLFDCENSHIGARHLGGYHFETKNLSVNSVDSQINLPKRDDRCYDVVECDKAALKLLISHQ